jgi:hypothetical protein
MQFRSQCGSVLIQVAIGLLALVAFAGFTIDQGLMWVARREAQNIADAGALAGAVSRAFDEVGITPVANGPTERSITGITSTYPPLFAGRQRGVTWSWACPPWAVGGAGGTGCVRVNVYQDGSNGSARMPVFFMQAVGVTDQSTKAMAIAQASAANGTDCLRPFAVPDKWVEANMPPSPDSFNKWETQGGNRGTPIVPPDVYTAPSATSPGTGYTLAVDYGTEFTLVYGPGGAGRDGEQRRGWYQPIDIPRADGAPTVGGARYRDNIANCNGMPIGLGSYLPTETGAMRGPTTMGIEDLIAQDPNADWNPTTRQVDGSCVLTQNCPNGYTGSISPRVITLALYNTEAFQYGQATGNWRDVCPTGGTCVQIVNYLGFFVDRMSGNDVIGYLVRVPGIIVAGAPSITPAAAFTIAITLIG